MVTLTLSRDEVSIVLLALAVLAEMDAAEVNDGVEKPLEPGPRDVASRIREQRELS